MKAGGKDLGNLPAKVCQGFSIVLRHYYTLFNKGAGVASVKNILKSA